MLLLCHGTGGTTTLSSDGFIDLKCKEQVSDSDSEGHSDEEPLIENKVFPQQRFSPVMKTNLGSEVTYRPKPIKARPTPSPRPGTNANFLIPGLSVGVGNVAENGHISRPRNSGSGFQPTGSVFQDVSQSPRSKTECSQKGNQQNTSIISLHSSNEMSRLATGIKSHGASPENTSDCSQFSHLYMKPSCKADSNASNRSGNSGTVHVITNLGLNSSSSQGETAHKTNDGNVFTNKPHVIVETRPGLEIATSHGNTDPKPMTRLIMAQKLPPPLTIPALVSVSGSGVATITNSHANSVVTIAPMQSSPTITPTSTLHVHSEPHSVHLNVQSPSVLHSPSPKSPSGTILVPSPGIGVTQYSMTIVNPTHATIAKMPNFVSVEPLATATSTPLPSTTASCSTGFLTTTLKNVVSTSKSSENVPSNSPSTATVLTNFVWKVGNTDGIASPTGTSVAHMSQERTPPAQLQYILPSFTLQASPAGKGPTNVLSMAIPGGSVPSGGIQIAIPTGPVQAGNLHSLTSNGQVVQSSSQGPGKIQFGPVVTAKMVVPTQQPGSSTTFTSTPEVQQQSNSVIVSKPLGLSMVHTSNAIGPSIGIQQTPIQLTPGQTVALSPSTNVSHAPPRLLVPSPR